MTGSGIDVQVVVETNLSVSQVARGCFAQYMFASCMSKREMRRVDVTIKFALANLCTGLVCCLSGAHSGWWKIGGLWMVAYMLVLLLAIAPVIVVFVVMVV